MEFLRFGSSIPGNYWGCCAVDIIQNFKVDPDAKASIEIVGGDGGGSTGKFAGPTYRDIFLQRLRFGTMSTTEMPNHGFIAILSQWQVTSDIGKKWLAILKEAGFEYIRTVNNSVYSGASLAMAPSAKINNNDNHIFMLVRNIGNNSLRNNFQPPQEWMDLPSVKTEQWQWNNTVLGEEGASLTKAQFTEDMIIWNKIGPAKLLTEAQIVDAGAPVIMAGIRPGPGTGGATPTTGFIGAKPESKEMRELRMAQNRGMIEAWTNAGKPLINADSKPFSRTNLAPTIASDVATQDVA